MVALPGRAAVAAAGSGDGSPSTHGFSSSGLHIPAPPIWRTPPPAPRGPRDRAGRGCRSSRRALLGDDEVAPPRPVPIGEFAVLIEQDRQPVGGLRVTPRACSPQAISASCASAASRVSWSTKPGSRSKNRRMIFTCSAPMSPAPLRGRRVRQHRLQAPHPSSPRAAPTPGPHGCADAPRPSRSATTSTTPPPASAPPTPPVGTSASAATSRCVIAGSRRVNASHSWAAAVRSAVVNPSSGSASSASNSAPIAAMRFDDGNRTHTSNTSSNHRQESS